MNRYMKATIQAKSFDNISNNTMKLIDMRAHPINSRPFIPSVIDFKFMMLNVMSDEHEYDW